MIISLTNGTKIELSSSEMAELAKHSVDVFSPMAVKTMEVVSPAPTPKVGEVKRGRGRPRKDVPTQAKGTGTKHKHHKARGGSIIDKVREHYGDNTIRHDSKLYLQEKYHYLRHGKKFTWEK